MSKGTIELDTLTGIGNAIRAKLGVETTYTPGQMAGAIASIPTGGITPTGTVNINQNGTHDVTEYASANVNVPNSYAAGDEGKVVQNGALVGQTSKSVTANGTVDTTTNDEVEVNVQPNLQSKTATQNGTVTADAGYDGLSSVVVNVSGGGGTEPALPSEYQEVEYIDFTPHAGYSVTIPQTAVWEIKVSPDTIPSSGDYCAFGYRLQTSNAMDFEFRLVNTHEMGFWLRNTNVDSDYIASVSVGDIVTLRGTMFGARTTAFIGRYATYSSTAYFGFDGKIYYVKGWDLYGELKCKFVPCYRKADNVVGFYDVVNDVFYSTLSSQGGGSVAKGPDVT